MKKEGKKNEFSEIGPLKKKKKKRGELEHPSLPNSRGRKENLVMRTRQVTLLIHVAYILHVRKHPFFHSDLNKRS